MSGSKSDNSTEQQLDFKDEGNGGPSSEGAGAAQSDTPSLGERDPPTSETPLTAEEMQAVMSEQPTGAAPSSEEIEDRRDAQSSAQNLVPREKLENGIKQVCIGVGTGDKSCCTPEPILMYIPSSAFLVRGCQSGEFLLSWTGQETEYVLLYSVHTVQSLPFSLNTVGKNNRVQSAKLLYYKLQAPQQQRGLAEMGSSFTVLGITISDSYVYWFPLDRV